MQEEFELYESIFGVKNYLSHYTNFTNLCSIISTMTLKVCSFARANDIGEIESNVSCILNSQKEKDVERYIKEYCGYISFSSNKRCHTKFTNPKFGFLIPSMWGIYADKSHGACIVIDEDALKKENKEALDCAKWNKFIDVSYSKFQNLKLASSMDDPETIVQSLYQHILGTKHKSWSQEQERRLIGVDLPSTLSLKNGVIKGVVIGKLLSLQEKQYLLSILNDPNLACYNQLDRSIFVRQEIIGGNIYTTGFGKYFY